MPIDTALVAMDDARETQLTAAFLEGGSTVAGLKLRPFTVGSANKCKAMKLTLFLGEGEGELTTQEQVAAFAWMQSAPLPLVVSSVRDGSWPLHVELFEFTLTMEQIGLLISEISRITAQAGAAGVTVIPQPSTPGAETAQPPGN